MLWCTLAETERQIRDAAKAHGWDLSGVDIVNLAEVDRPHAGSQEEYSFFSPGDVELNDVVHNIIETTSQRRPRRIAFDPFSDVKLLARDPLRFRRQLLRLRDHFSELGTTVLLIQESHLTSEQDVAGEGVVHGVIALFQHAPDFGKQRRRLRVRKLRGIPFREGYHDMTIETSGVQVFPRLVASEHDEQVERGAQSSGDAEFDKMLGGGVDLGSSMLVTGPSGVGKSTICMQFANTMAEHGGKAVIFMFDETRRALLARADALGMQTRRHVEDGTVEVRQIDPAEFSPGEFAHLARKAVEQDGARLVVIDSLNGYMAAMPDEKHLAMRMHELLTYLVNRNVCTLVTLNQQGIVGEQSHSSVDVTYLTDTAVLIRYFELAGEVRRALAVVKRRIGEHDPSIREMRISPPGIQLLGTLKGFRGVLTGQPESRSIDDETQD